MEGGGSCSLMGRQGVVGVTPTLISMLYHMGQVEGLSAALVQYDETQAQGSDSFLPAHWATGPKTRFAYLFDTRQVGNFIPPSAGKGATFLLFKNFVVELIKLFM